MRLINDAELLRVGDRLDTESLAARHEAQRKRLLPALLAWLCLGSHYLYLGRPRTQALFWLTAGGLLLWWIADLLRLPAMVERRNRRALRALIETSRLLTEQRLHERIAAAPWPSRQPLPRYAEDAPGIRGDLQPPGDAAAASAGAGTGRWSLRTGPAIALALALTTVIGVYVLAPPQMYPPSREPSFRTVRQVNARKLPSTASSIQAVIEKNVILTGRVEEVTAAGPSKWLRITRGTHHGRYVALQNLERR
jgi:hypothetical protein